MKATVAIVLQNLSLLAWHDIPVTLEYRINGGGGVSFLVKSQEVINFEVSF